MSKVFALLSFIVFVCDVYAGSDQAEVNSNMVFSHSAEDGVIYYSKLEPSGCVTELKLNDNSSAIDLTYGGVCEVTSAELEAVTDIANSFYEIVKYNKLENVVKSKKVLTINYIWKVSHWPLMRFVNEDDAWPMNIFQDLRSEYPDRKNRYIKYKSILRNTLLKQQVYLPFTVPIKKLKCYVDLSADYADPVFIDNKNITKKKLVKWGVFTSQQAKKNIYPLIKGPIKFNITCSPQNRGQTPIKTGSYMDTPH